MQGTRVTHPTVTMHRPRPGNTSDDADGPRKVQGAQTTSRSGPLPQSDGCNPSPVRVQTPLDISRKEEKQEKHKTDM